MQDNLSVESRTRL